MRSIRVVSSIVSCALVACIVACGSSRGSDGGSAFVFPKGDDAPAQPSPEGTLGDGGSDLVDFDTACATSKAAAVPRPAYLVYMFDRSESMANDAKWQSVTTSMKSFFADARTQGMNASLQFFPMGDDMCTADYSKAALDMRPLPDGPAFALAIDLVGPLGRTPTVPALKGAIAYAEEVYKQHGQDGKVAIIFVTDGNPDGCESTVPLAGEEVYKVADHISTHVIGIGSNLSSLNYIAKRGGTTEAVLVDADPAKTASALVDAMDKITRSALSCEYGIPQPQEGETLNYLNVNVIHTSQDGKGHGLTYNRLCANGGDGWYYDNVNAPTKIIMCPTTCKAVIADRRSKVDILFGCATRGDIR